jgi:hypothetical protein
VTSQPTRFPFLLTSQDCKRRSTSVFHVMPSACMMFFVYAKTLCLVVVWQKGKAAGPSFELGKRSVIGKWHRRKS